MIPEFAKQVETAERVMREDRDACGNWPNNRDGRDCLASGGNGHRDPPPANS